MLVRTEDHAGGIVPFRGQEAAWNANGIVAKLRTVSGSQPPEPRSVADD